MSDPWIEDGHLGGYIPGGDPCTFCPSLWEQLIADYDVKSVLDIGCAEGQAMKWFADHGCQVQGIEGCELAIRNHLMPDRVVPHDFTTGPWTGPPVDLVWCSEVLEHIEEKYLPNLLAAMNGRVLAVTAATPGQHGYHHVNLQYVPYWIGKFAEIGFRYDEAATRRYKSQGKDIGWWWWHNGLIFTRRNHEKVSLG